MDYSNEQTAYKFDDPRLVADWSKTPEEREAQMD